MRHIFRTVTVLILGMMILTMPCTAYAAPVGELVELDKFTGEVIDSESENQNEVALSDRCSYLREEQVYRYITSTSRDSDVKCSVPDGMVTTDIVSIYAGEAAQLAIYQNGERLLTDKTTEINISEPGAYKVFAGDFEVLSFRIIESPASGITGYTLPKGFSLVSAELDEQSFGNDSSYVSMEKEGKYYIKYKCDATDVSYTLSVYVDNTPPVITLEGVKDGVANGPVTIVGLEDGATVIGTLNGKKTDIHTEIRNPGRYEIAVKDKAGNASIYSFTIRTYLNLPGWAAIALAALVIIVFVGFIIYSRKHLKVR